MSSLAGSSSSSSSSRKALFQKQYLQLINANHEQVNKLKDACIGGGSFGKVYRVRHTKEKKCYAAKLINKAEMKQQRGESAVKKMDKEVKSLATLTGHTHVVTYKTVAENCESKAQKKIFLGNLISETVFVSLEIFFRYSLKSGNLQNF